MLKKFYYIVVLTAMIGFSQCSDPSQSAAEQSANEANDTDSSSSNAEFNRDTTIDLNSGGGAGTPTGKADTLATDSSKQTNH